MGTARIALEIFGSVVGLPLQALIVAALLRGPYRQFPLVFAYTIANLLASVLEACLTVLYRFDTVTERFYARTYWIDEQILLTLIYAVVIGMILQATASARSRRIVRAGVIAVVFLFAAITFLIHFDGRIAMGAWMTPWTSELHFFVAILDLVLWAMLIALRKKDERLLFLSGALGIMFTGEAIGNSVRQLSLASRSLTIVYIGDVIKVVSNLVFLYMWWRVFRKPLSGRDARPAFQSK
jgi:hypothetical protein